MNKKAQAQIITTVLIILLVLAAIVIVWQVVSSTITESTEEIPGQTDCLSIKLDIEEATALSALKVKRGTGSGDLIGIRVFIDNAAATTDTSLTINELEIKDTGYTIAAGDANKNIKIAKLVGDNLANARLCPFSDNSINGIKISPAPA